jgi:acyl-ACP thioesterase
LTSQQVLEYNEHSPAGLFFMSNMSKGISMSRKQNIYVDPHDIDYNGVARASAVLKYLQIAADAQLYFEGPSNEKLWEEGKAFLVSSIDLTLDRPLYAHADVVAESWACPGRGFIFPRCYRLMDQAGVAVRGTSNWALVESESRKLLRVSDYPAAFAYEPPLDYTARRFVVPHKEEMQRAGEYTVTYTQTDRNRHLNNTCYPDMFTSFVGMQGRRVSHMGIRFLKEAPMGEVLTIYTQEAGDTCRFLSVRRDGEINAEAEMTFVKL